MSKEARLHGRGVFSEVIRAGGKIDGRYVRCFFRVRPDGPAVVRAGFTASSKTYGAVRRNRFKRVLREAYRAEYPELREICLASGAGLDAVFLIRSQPVVERLGLGEAKADVSEMCRRLIVRCRRSAS